MRRTMSALLAAAAVVACPAVVAQDATASHVLTFTDSTVEVRDDDIFAAVADIDTTSAHAAPWRPVLEALSRNATIRFVIDDATAPATRTDRATAHLRANNAAMAVLAQGLRRADDDDLIAARPLLRKILGAPTGECRDAADQSPMPNHRIQVETELVGLGPVLTRAVEAVNAGRPVSDPTDDEVRAALERSFASLGGRGLADMSDALAGGLESCAAQPLAVRIRFDGPAADAPLLMRGLLKSVGTAAMRPRDYKTGDPIAYPREGLSASVTGSQRVRFTIDASGRLKSTTFLRSDFTPATIVRADATTIASHEIFDREIENWLRAQASTYPLKVVDGAPAETTFEVPFNWRFD